MVFSQLLPTICVLGSACYQGSWLNGTNTTFASFQGIRYAQPPVGKLRFKSPQPYLIDEGITIDVSKESKIICPQIESIPIGQEDCLVLNVYVPESVYNDPSSKVPVLAWIHGGSLVSF